jgi:hypothetical protein
MILLIIYIVSFISAYSIIRSNYSIGGKYEYHTASGEEFIFTVVPFVNTIFTIIGGFFYLVIVMRDSNFNKFFRIK